MRNLSALIIFLMAATAFAEKTLIDEYDSWNLFSKFELKRSDIGPDSGWIGGVQAGGLLNDRLGLGLAGYALVEDLNSAPVGYEPLNSLDLFYGGAIVEYRILKEQVFHFSLGLFAGLGRMDLQRSVSHGKNETRFTVIEPHANVLIHITPTVDLGLGAGYRWAELRKEPAGYGESALDSAVWTLFLRFTEF